MPAKTRNQTESTMNLRTRNARRNSVYTLVAECTARKRSPPVRGAPTAWRQEPQRFRHRMHCTAAPLGPSRNALRESAHHRCANAPRDSACPSAERIPHRSRSFNRQWHGGRSRNAPAVEPQRGTGRRLSGEPFRSRQSGLIYFDPVNAQRGMHCAKAHTHTRSGNRIAAGAATAPWIVANAKRGSAFSSAERRLHGRRSFNRSLHGMHHATAFLGVSRSAHCMEAGASIRNLKFTLIHPARPESPASSLFLRLLPSRDCGTAKPPHPNPAKFGLIYFDSVGSTLTRKIPFQQPAASPFRSPVSGFRSRQFGLIHFDSVGLHLGLRAFPHASSPMVSRQQSAAFPSSLTSLGLPGADHLLAHSAFLFSCVPHSKSLSHSGENPANFGLIYFDSVNAQRGMHCAKAHTHTRSGNRIAAGAATAPWIVAERSLHGGRNLKFTRMPPSHITAARQPSSPAPSPLAQLRVFLPLCETLPPVISPQS
jgi:hypothetical protein